MHVNNALFPVSREGPTHRRAGRMEMGRANLGPTSAQPRPNLGPTSQCEGARSARSLFRGVVSRIACEAPADPERPLFLPSFLRDTPTDLKVCVVRACAREK